MEGNQNISEKFSLDLFKSAALPYFIILPLSWILPIEVAGKIFLSLYVVLYFFSMDYFYKSIGSNPEIPQVCNQWYPSTPKSSSGISVCRKQASHQLLTGGFRQNQQVHLLLSLFFVFSWTFFMAMPGFLISVPLYFIFLGWWYKNKDNFLILVLFLVILLFAHLYTLLLFLFSIVFLEYTILRKRNFYLSLLPLMLLMLLIFVNSPKSTTIEDAPTVPISFFIDLLYKFINFSTYSFFGVFFLLFIFLFALFTKTKFNFNRFFILSLVFLILVVLIPENLIDEWQSPALRLLPFIFPLVITAIPEFKKQDQQFLLCIIAVAFIFMFAFYFYIFSGFNEKMEHILSIKSLIEPNSSIGAIFTPSRFENVLSVQPLFHAHHYLTLNIEGSYGTDLFSYWYNPIVVNYPEFSDFEYLKKIKENLQYVLDYNCYFLDDYILLLKNSSLYPQTDYLVLFDDKCNFSEYFLNEYEIIYNNETVLMKLK